MATDDFSLKRREVMKSIGGFAALSALAPWIEGCDGDCDGEAETFGSSALVPGSPEEVGISKELLEDVFARIARRVNDGLFPGATALVARRGKIVGLHAFGNRVRGTNEATTVDTLFDLESMTKVVATSTAALILVQQGAIRLSDRVAEYLPDFAANGKADITIRDMLRYSAGLPVDNQFLDNPDDTAVWQLMAETPLEYVPGAKVLYSDLTYRLLGRLIEVVSGTDLSTFAHAHIWQPLGMNDTMFNPPAALIPRIAATDFSPLRGYMVRGEVQDEQDYALGGIAGCDGVFSTAADLAVFCQMILNGGVYGGVRILSHNLTRSMVQNQTPQVTAGDTDQSLIENLLLTPKGYGWELATSRFSTAGMRVSSKSYGKAGGAGTFMWIDPSRKVFGILLTNHGLPVPFDGPGWDTMIDAVNPGEFFDGIINAVEG
jgi:serine-type D-Ala-D-Ala carboxypeptidase